MRAALSVLLAFTAACAAPAEPTPTVLAAPQPPVSEPAQPPVEPQVAVPGPFELEPGAIASNGGAYGVRMSPAAGEFPDNEAFRFEVWITAADPSRLERLSLSVDAAMPQHGHGMNRVPRVSRVESGHFLVEGMYFHMTGKWELYLDITEGALTERAQCVVELADE